MRSSIPNILAHFDRATWAILPEKHAVMREFLELRAAGVQFTEHELQARGIRAAAGRPLARAAGQIVVLPLYGCIGQHMGMEMRISGGTSTEAFGRAFDDAMKNQDVGTIVIDCDSPGGSVHGVPELAAKIFKARGQGKKIIAVANSSMNSAAYWICAAADEIVAAPSADVGSIGVFTMHTDTTGADEQAGLKRTVIAAGKYKGEAAPGVPLTDDAQAALKARVDEMYAMFAGNVAKFRGASLAAVKNGYGEGRSIGAKAALDAGMIDRINTLEEVIADLAGSTGSSQRMAAVADGRVAAGGDLSELHAGRIRQLSNRELRALVTRIYASDDLEDDDELCPDCGEPMTDDHQCPPESIPTPDEGPEARGRARDGEPPIPAITRPAPQARSSTMSDQDTAAERAAIEAAARSAETTRVSEIYSLCAEHKVDAAQRDEWIAKGVGVDAVSRQILALGRERAAAGTTVRVGADREADKPFANVGEQLFAIMQAGRYGRKDARLDRVNHHAMRVDRAGATEMFAGSPSGMNESVGSEGGFFIAPEVLPDIMQPVYAEDPILSRVTRIPIGSQTNRTVYNVVDESARTDGNRWGGMQMFWGDEADTATAKKPKMRQVEQLLKKLIGIGYLTDEMVQDAPASQTLLETAFLTEYRFMVGNGIFRGKGGGQMVGFLNGKGGVAQAIEAGQTILNTSQSISQNVTKMLANIPASLWGDVIFLYNQELLAPLVNATIGTSSLPVFIGAGGLAGRPSDTILGKPAFASELCEAPGTPGDIVAIAPSQYHLAEKGGAQIATSLHVRFLNDELTMRITARLDGKPVWNTTVTPFKGTTPRGFFSTLAARS